MNSNIKCDGWTDRHIYTMKGKTICIPSLCGGAIKNQNVIYNTKQNIPNNMTTKI